MKKIKPLTIVKYDYESLDNNWKKENINIYKNMQFIYFGKIPNMPGHVYLQNLKTEKFLILHIDEIIECDEDET